MSRLISVIIPVYNPGDHLIKCLDSIINQTYKNLEIILVDDGSTDGSSKVCDEYAKKDNRIRCVHQNNSGVSSARNKGISLATGDYYHFPDSDDYIELDTYEYLLGLIVEHECDMVNFEYYVTYLDHETTHLLSDDHYGLFGARDSHRLIMTGEPFAWNKLFSKKLITANGYLPGIKFREDIYRGEDSLFAHEATDRAEKVWFDKRTLYHYVQCEESAVRGKFRVSQLSALKLYDAYKPLYYEKYPELKIYFFPMMSHLMITLYYDMYTDDVDYKTEMSTVYKAFNEHLREVFRNCNISLKEQVKFRLFSLSPGLFCVFHQKIHHL